MRGDRRPARGGVDLMATVRDVAPALRAFASEVGARGPRAGRRGRHRVPRGGPGGFRGPGGPGPCRHPVLRAVGAHRPGRGRHHRRGTRRCALRTGPVRSPARGGGLHRRRRPGRRPPGGGRAGSGPVRNSLLEATYVDAWGRVVRAGAPVVKNVSGFDLCRLLVGSLGTVGLIAEVVLRTTPLPGAEQWMTGAADVDAVRAAVSRPAAVLWDGSQVWVLLRGHPADVAAGAASLAAVGCGDVATGAPPLPPHRWSVDPSRVDQLADGRAGSLRGRGGRGGGARLRPRPPPGGPGAARGPAPEREGPLRPGRPVEPGALAVGRRRVAGRRRCPVLGRRP